MDFKRFRIYLNDKFDVGKAYLFIGYIPGNEPLYESLQQAGYEVIFKRTLPDENGNIKGNCDAEMILHCMLQYDHFDQAIIVSGDGDFHCLIEQLYCDNKLHSIGIPNRYRYSSLLRRFRSHFFFIEHFKERLRKIKERE